MLQLIVPPGLVVIFLPNAWVVVNVTVNPEVIVTLSLRVGIPVGELPVKVQVDGVVQLPEATEVKMAALRYIPETTRNVMSVIIFFILKSLILYTNKCKKRFPISLTYLPNYEDFNSMFIS